MTGKNITDLTTKTFDAFIKKGVVVVDFWASWCGPCIMTAPIFEETANEFKGKVKFGKVDVDKHTEIAQNFEVLSIPTLIIFKNGEQVDRVIGAVPKEELIERIKSVK